MAAHERQALEETPEAAKVAGARTAIAAIFLKGVGIEVGAGSRPWPVPAGVTVLYGDVRDADALRAYFRQDVIENGFIDAQTFRGIADDSQDFVLSAHVIEHLRDPIGSIRQMLRVVRPGGVVIVAVPDKRYTFDQNRPRTSLAHLISDASTGGEPTLREAYAEHMRYVHPYMTGVTVPEADISKHVDHGVRHGIDIHVHSWTEAEFDEMLAYMRTTDGFDVVATAPIINENIFVLRKKAVQV